MFRKFEATFYLKKTRVFNLIYYEFLRCLRPYEQLSSETIGWVLLSVQYICVTKVFKRHSAIIEKYGTTLREIRLAIQNRETPPYPLLF